MIFKYYVNGFKNLENFKFDINEKKNAANPFVTNLKNNNYRRLSLIYGKNGAGKTNFLESLNVLINSFQ
jgi:AAA15 family ATPase/GTPase